MPSTTDERFLTIGNLPGITYGEIVRFPICSPDLNISDLQSTSRPTANPTNRKSNCIVTLLSGRFSRTPMKPLLTERPTISCSGSATVGAELHQWVKCRLCPAWYSVPTAVRSCTRCADAIYRKASTWFAPPIVNGEKKSVPHIRSAIPLLRSSCWTASAM